MEIYEFDDESLDDFISIKIIGIGASGASALNYFSDVGHDIFPARLIVSDENDVADLQDFVDHCDWLFVIMDLKDLELAEKVAKTIKITKTALGYQFPLVTFLILCPTAADVQLADIPAEFGTWIILPEDKIDAIGLTSNELIYRIISVNVSLVLTVNMSEIHSPADLSKPRSRRERNYVAGMDILDVMETIGNFGRACIGFGESLDAENAPLAAVKNALQSPLFVEDIGKAKKGLLVFVVKSRESVDMMKVIEAAAFLEELMYPEDDWRLLLQVLIDETSVDGVTAFVLATNFDFCNGEDESCDKFFSGIKIVGIGETGASASDYFGEVADDVFPARLIISDKDASSQNPFAFLATISRFRTSWLFVITDVEDLELAAKVARIVESSKNLLTAHSCDELKFPMVTFLMLCPTADDDRLADIPAEFGTWIILPEDKIAETGLTKNEAIYRAVNMMTSTASLTKNCGSLIGWDFGDVVRTISNGGRACIGFGVSLDAENNSIQAVKNALQSPLFIEDIGKAKKGLLVFSGGGDFLSMLEANEASTFLEELMYPEDGWRLLLQVDVDETATDGVTAFIFATNFGD